MSFSLIAGCTDDDEGGPGFNYSPKVSDTWQWQLTGNINTSYDVLVYDVDLVETPEATIELLHSNGRKVICYFSAGSYEPYRPDSGDFLQSDLGAVMEGFTDEKWLDINSPNVRRIMKARLDIAKQKGCDGVEPDNVDGFDNVNGLGLTAADQLAYNIFIASEAHARNLVVGLKNDLGQVGELVSHFDFAVNEQCHEYNECHLLQPFLDSGKPVFNAEYAASFVANPQTLCAQAKIENLRTLILPEDLDDSFRMSCDSDF